MKYASKEQLIESLRLLATFRGKADRQTAQHILPFLAIRRKDVEPGKMTAYSERDDFTFFDEFARVSNEDKPYFDPIAGAMRVASHPHSNVATLRKNTFFRRWHAAEQDVDNGIERWKLADDYLPIFKKKLTKGKAFTPIPAIPLGLFLFRTRAFPDQATLDDVAAELKSTFHLTTTEFNELFETGTRPTAPFAAAPLSGDDVVAAIRESGVVAETAEARATFQALTIKPDDDILQRTKQLLEDGYAGVIFVGPPGTSKSWYAVQVALALAEGERSRIRQVQFHRSFQYEQFVEGFVPNDDGDGFELRDQVMLLLIDDAEANPGSTFVMLIDELSRSDPGRVFGELLTYMEPTRRGEPFLLASGREISVPPNIVFLATMNSRDKSVAEIDDAFDRRMAKVDFPPDRRIADQFLRDNRVPDDLRGRILAFFDWVNTDRKYPLGHAYFRTVKDVAGLRRLWESQLRFVFEKHFKYEPAVQESIRVRFEQVIAPPAPAVAPAPPTPPTP